MDPLAAAAGFRLPEGFRAEVFAAEPDVQNPVAMTWDGRGRLWVAEYYTYADRPLRFDLTLRDRVLILADRDGDGRADERHVFCDNVQRLTSVEVGLGGVWLIACRSCSSFPTATATTCPTGRRRSCSTALRPPPRTITTAPTACAGGPTAGSTAAAARRVPAGSARPGSPRTSACRSSAASGAIIRRERCSRRSATARPTPGVTTGMSTASCSSPTRSPGTCFTCCRALITPAVRRSRPTAASMIRSTRTPITCTGTRAAARITAKWPTMRWAAATPTAEPSSISPTSGPPSTAASC